MSLDLDEGDQIYSPAGSEEPAQSLFGEDWNKRLSEARKKRAESLAQKKSIGKADTPPHSLLLAMRASPQPDRPIPSLRQGLNAAPSVVVPAHNPDARPPLEAPLRIGQVTPSASPTVPAPDISEDLTQTLFGEDWDRRLIEARKRRERALAEKAALAETTAPAAPVPLGSPAPQGIATATPPAALAEAQPASDAAAILAPPKTRGRALGRGALACAALILIGAGGTHLALQSNTAEPGAATLAARPEIAANQAPVASALSSDLDALRLVVFRPQGSGNLLSPVEQRADQLNVLRFGFERSAVHYFRDQDAAAAREVAAELDADIVDLSGLHPAPPAGTLNVYIADASQP